MTRIRIGFTLSTLAALCCSNFIVAAVAAPVSVGGASLDAPTSCVVAEGALVCKLDNVQFELWVTHKPLAPSVQPSDAFAKKMAYFADVHERAVEAIMNSTQNDSASATQFSNYGAFSAMGTALPGKGVPTSPSVHFASVLHDEEIWEFMEVVAARSPAIDALSKSLQASLKLPAAIPAKSVAKAATTPATPVAVSPSPSLARAPEKVADKPTAANDVIEPTAPDARLETKALTLQYPTFLTPTVIDDRPDTQVIRFKHRTRASGPNLTVTLTPRAAATDDAKLAAEVNNRRSELSAKMLGQVAVVDANAFGALRGAGFAMIGTPDSAKGGTGVEMIETQFVANIKGRTLDVRLSAEQKHAGEAQAAWGLIARTLTLRP